MNQLTKEVVPNFEEKNGWPVEYQSLLKEISKFLRLNNVKISVRNSWYSMGNRLDNDAIHKDKIYKERDK